MLMTTVVFFLLGVLLGFLGVIAPAIYAAGLIAAAAVFLVGAAIVSELAQLRRAVEKRSS